MQAVTSQSAGLVVDRGGVVTEVVRSTLASTKRGTMLALAAYIRDIGGLVAPEKYLGGENS